MSKRRNPASTEIVNPTLVDSTNYREKAKRLKKNAIRGRRNKHSKLSGQIQKQPFTAE